MNMKHFGWTNELTCEKKKTNFRNGGKICLPRAPTFSSLLRIVNSNFYRTATQTMKWLSGGVVPKSSIRKLPNTSRRRRTPSSTLSKTMTTGNPCTPSADSQWSSVVNWECLQYHLQRMRRTPPMLAAQRPRPNTRVTNSSGPSWNQKRSTVKNPQQVKQVDVNQDKDPQIAKSSWPQGRNWGLYHRSPRSKLLNTLAPTQHPQEAWCGPKM